MLSAPTALVLAATTVAAASAAILFENAAPKNGISFVLDNSVTPQKHQVETMISGLAMIDFDADGWQDLYFVNGARLPAMDKSDPRFWNRLYRNNRDGTFADVTEKAGVKGEGYAMGVAAGDYDNDGYPDLYVTGVNRNHLFHNNGDGTFSDVTQRAGVAGIHPELGKTWAISAGWFDYDNDGDLDLFVVNYVRWSAEKEPVCQVDKIRSYCSPDSYDGEPNLLYRNNGDGTFADVSASSGIGKHTGKGMGVVFADADQDGFTDVFVANDTLRNFLFHNNGDGTFTEEGIQAGVAYNENGKSIAGMGADFRDLDNDGRPDIFVVAMIGDTYPVFRNRNGRSFIDITNVSGVGRASIGRTAWGAAAADFDNDGHKDLFAACASILDNSEEIDHLPAKLPNLLLRNTGGARFQDVSAAAGSSFQVPKAHRGVAAGDLNNDGRLDVVVVAQHTAPSVFLNRSPQTRHWLQLELKGHSSNRQGLGARIKLIPEGGGAPLYNHATTSVGFSASSDGRVHFGLGSAPRAARIEIAWPSGIEQVLTDVKANQILQVEEPVSASRGKR